MSLAEALARHFERSAARVRRAGVYVLMLRGAPVYVGASRDVDIRLGMHRAGHSLRNQPAIEFDEAFVLVLPEPDVWLYERALIYALLPERNTHVQPIGAAERAVLENLGVSVVDEESSLDAVRSIRGRRSAAGVAAHVVRGTALDEGERVARRLAKAARAATRRVQ